MKTYLHFFFTMVLVISVLLSADELTIIDPNGDETLSTEMPYTIIWEPAGIPSQVAISFSSDNGGTWNPVATVTNTGTYEWETPAIASDFCLIRICDANDLLVCDTSDAVFILYECPVAMVGDLNHDCYVDLGDLNVISTSWLKCFNPFDSVCSCGGDYFNCDGDPANGCEVNINTDPAHCGACGNACLLPNAVSGCQSKLCVVASCLAGYGNCDDDSANGCEVNIATDPANCGACGHVCSLPNAVSGCQNQLCVVASCLAGYGNCDGDSANGCEINTQTNVNHCGACGNACSAPYANMTCSNGVCAIASCQAGRYDCDGIVSNGCEGVMNDPYEPNPNCSAPRYLGTIAELSSEQYWSAQILPTGDEDWFRFYAQEGSHTCFPGSDQDYRIRVRLIPPQGANCKDYDLYLYNDSCGLLGSSTQTSCSEEQIIYDWDGQCGTDDSQYFRVRVIGHIGSWSCSSYTLLIDMWQL